MPGFWKLMRSGAGVSGGVGEDSLGRLDICERFAYDLLGDAGAFSALGADTGRRAYFPIAAAAFIDGFANLTVGNTLAKTDVHKNYPLSLFDVGDAKQNENDCQSILFEWSFSRTVSFLPHKMWGGASEGDGKSLKF